MNCLAHSPIDVCTSTQALSLFKVLSMSRPSTPVPGLKPTKHIQTNRITISQTIHGNLNICRPRKDPGQPVELIAVPWMMLQVWQVNCPFVLFSFSSFSLVATISATRTSHPIPHRQSQTLHGTGIFTNIGVVEPLDPPLFPKIIQLAKGVGY